MSAVKPSKKHAGASAKKHGANTRGAATGAVHTKARFSGRFSSWLKHHKTSAMGALWRIFAQPMQAFMTIVVLAIALALPVMLLLALENVTKLGDAWDANPSISVFINPLAKPRAIEQLQQDVAGWPGVQSVEYISPAQALADFQQTSDMGDILTALDDNPLPPTLLVTPQDPGENLDALQALLDKLNAQSIVESADLDMDWVKKLHQMMLLAQSIVSVLAGLLTLGVLLVIGNTIRLAIESRRDEIVVSKLVGGTDAFVRRPFIYLGFWYGLLSSALAALAIVVAWYKLSGPVSALAAAYGSNYQLDGLGFEDLIYVLTAGAAMGLVGAWMSVGRHLSEIEPD